MITFHPYELVIFLAMMAAGLVLCYIAGKYVPARRMLDDAWEEGYDTGRDSATPPPVPAEPEPAESTIALEPQDAAQLAAVLLTPDDPAYWYPEAQQARRMAARAAEAGERPPLASELAEQDWARLDWADRLDLSVRAWGDRERAAVKRWRTEPTALEAAA